MLSERLRILSEINDLEIAIQNIQISLTERQDIEFEQIGDDDTRKAKAWDLWFLYSLNLDRVKLMNALLKGEAWDYMSLYVDLGYTDEKEEMETTLNNLHEDDFSFEFFRKAQAWDNLAQSRFSESVGWMSDILTDDDTIIAAFDTLYGEAVERSKNMANIALGIDFFGEEIDVKFENETKYINPQTGELVSTIPELLNKGEQQEYKRYDELKLYLELNASLENSLEEGRLAINDILALFPAIGGIKSAVRFTEGHSLLVELSGTIGIDFAKLLSDDLADIDDALRAKSI